jgi:hypothetical protein
MRGRRRRRGVLGVVSDVRLLHGCRRVSKRHQTLHAVREGELCECAAATVSRRCPDAVWFVNSLWTRTLGDEAEVEARDTLRRDGVQNRQKRSAGSQRWPKNQGAA